MPAELYEDEDQVSIELINEVAKLVQVRGSEFLLVALQKDDAWPQYVKAFAERGPRVY